MKTHKNTQAKTKEKLNLVEEQMVLNSADSEKLFELYKEKELLENEYGETFIHWENIQR